MASLWFALAIGIVIGAVLGWLARSVRAGHGASAELIGRAAGAEAKAQELERQKIEQSRRLEDFQGQLREIENSRAALQAKLEQAEISVSEQRTLLQDAETKLIDSFKSVAADALRQNNQDFLLLAQDKLVSINQQAMSEMDARKAAVEDLVRPIHDQLTLFRSATDELEKRRHLAIGGIEEQLRSLQLTHTQLQGETSKLVNALSAPQVKGAWGEITLRRCAELAGMSSHCDFREQASVTTPDGRLRPDMIVELPGGRRVIVDSKVPLTAYLEAINANTPEARATALQRHAKLVRDHVTGLSGKDYPRHFPGSIDFVLLFIPSESFFAAAADQDPALIESAAEQGVVIVSPTTLIAMLRAIALGWEDQKRHENARQIFAQAQELVERIQVWLEHMANLRKGLIVAIDAHDKAVGSLDSRVLPSARRLKELDAGIKEELQELDPIGRTPRALNSPDVE